MAAKQFDSDNSLDVAQFAEVDRISLEFERAWMRKESPRIEEYLAMLDSPPPAGDVLFQELLALDVHYRRQRGEQPGAEDYNGRFPKHAGLISHLFSGQAAGGPPERDDEEEPGGSSFVDTQSRSDGDVSSMSQPPQLPPAPPLAPPVVRRRKFGRYEIIRPLGKGKFGRVFLARDPKLDRLVAIKVARGWAFSSRQTAEQFLSEARKAAQLDKHPGIITVHDAGQYGAACYIVMDYVEGGTLADSEISGRLMPSEIADLMARVADAVHFAHTRGLLHRDIKPANIVLDSKGEPRVADFGLAVHESEQLGKKGEVSGTLHYMSPEQALGHTEHLDGRTDVWSLGATLYELLTRRHLFEGSTADELLDQILHRDVKPPRQIDDSIPPALERVCLKALSKQPSARYSTARDFAEDLRRAARSDQLAVSPMRKVLWGLSLVTAALLLGVLIYLLAPPSFRREESWVPDSERVGVFPESPGQPITGIHFADNGRHAVSIDRTGHVCVWDVEQIALAGEPSVSGTAWRVLLSHDGNSLAALCLDLPYVDVMPLFGTANPAAPTRSDQPDLLFADRGDESIWAGVFGANNLQLCNVLTGERMQLPLTSPLSCPLGAMCRGRLAIVGYAEADDQWQLKMWEPAATPRAELEEAHGCPRAPGPVCSLDLSENGTLVLGGYGPDVGVQFWRPGMEPQRLDDRAEGLFYHWVAVSPDGRHVFAVSRKVADDSQDAELRAWSISEETPMKNIKTPVVKQPIAGPVQAVAFLAENDRVLVLLSISRALELWTLR